MVGVPQNDLRAGTLHLAGMQPAHGAVGADRHERRGLDGAGRSVSVPARAGAGRLKRYSNMPENSGGGRPPAPAAGALAAQSVEVRGPGCSGVPLAGAIVRLVDSAGRSRAQGLASDAGRIVLQAPGAGRWRLKVDGIGYRGHESEAFTMAAGEMGRRDVSLERNPVDCRNSRPLSWWAVAPRPGAVRGGRSDVLWEEIQKALVATRMDPGRRVGVSFGDAPGKGGSIGSAPWCTRTS